MKSPHERLNPLVPFPLWDAAASSACALFPIRALLLLLCSLESVSVGLSEDAVNCLWHADLTLLTRTAPKHSANTASQINGGSSLSSPTVNKFIFFGRHCRCFYRCSVTSGTQSLPDVCYSCGASYPRCVMKVSQDSQFCHNVVDTQVYNKSLVSRKKDIVGRNTFFSW